MSSQERLAVGRPSNTLHFIVGEMSGKLDQVLNIAMDERKRWADLDDRVGSLEVWRGRILGGGAVIVFLFGSVEALRYVSGR